MLNSLRRSEAGFTMIELVGAIAVIGVLGLATGQAARLNVVFLPAVQKGAPAQCTANLKIFDSEGNTLAQTAATLTPNQSSSLVFQPDPTAVEIHAAITIPECPDNSQSCPASQRTLQTACRRKGREFIGTMESFDPKSGGTIAILPAQKG